MTYFPERRYREREIWHITGDLLVWLCVFLSIHHVVFPFGSTHSIASGKPSHIRQVRNIMWLIIFSVTMTPYRNEINWAVWRLDLIVSPQTLESTSIVQEIIWLACLLRIAGNHALIPVCIISWEIKHSVLNYKQACLWNTASPS